MNYHKAMYGHRDPIELRQETIDRLVERQRRLDLISDKCVCSSPRPGPSYFKTVRCTCCERRIR